MAQSATWLTWILGYFALLPEPAFALRQLPHPRGCGTAGVLVYWQ